MARTARRPLPRGKISRAEALAFGLVVAGSAVVVLALVVNIKAAALLALAIFFYVVVYTIWLKRQTPQNIVIGGAAGALPPVIGWAAATGEIGHLNSSGSDTVPPGVGEPSRQDRRQRQGESCAAASHRGGLQPHRDGAVVSALLRTADERDVGYARARLRDSMAPRTAGKLVRLET